MLLAGTPACDVVIADDGLQHYRLARDVEIAVVDGERGLGNGWLLPAGPLREPSTRLADVDAVVVNGAIAGRGDWPDDAFLMTLVAGPLRRVDGAAGRGRRGDARPADVHASPASATRRGSSPGCAPWASIPSGTRSPITIASSLRTSRSATACRS